MSVASARSHSLFSLLTLLVTAGGLLLSPAARADAPAPRPFLVHINGIGGERTIDHVLVSGLVQGGFAGDRKFYDWTGGRIGLVALQAYDKHKTEARKVADLLIEHHAKHPAAPLYLTAHSGGAGIAAFALELLPDDVTVEAVAMFAPALSPEYDLSKALRRVTRKLYVFSSPLDAVVLSTGTKLFGTIDGVRCEAAGFGGFQMPESADEEQYGKISAHPYQRAWLLKYGNAGSHICAMRSKFAREYVAPLLMTGLLPPDADDAPTTRPSKTQAAAAP